MVFSLGPVWSLTTIVQSRGFENCQTSVRVHTFRSLEAPSVNLEDILKVQEQLVSYIVENVIKERQDDFAILKSDVSVLKNTKPPFERISYVKVIDFLRSKD